MWSVSPAWEGGNLGREGCWGVWMMSWGEEGEHREITDMWELPGWEVWRRTKALGSLFLALITALVTTSHMRGVLAGGAPENSGTSCLEHGFSVRSWWPVMQGWVRECGMPSQSWESTDAWGRMERGGKLMQRQGCKGIPEIQLRRLCGSSVEAESRSPVTSLLVSLRVRLASLCLSSSSVEWTYAH